jgi:hypothetical protein
MPRIPSTRLPIIITERAYARAVLAAGDEGMSLAEYTEAALAVAVARTEARTREADYATACQDARVRRMPNPTKRDYFGEQQSFVRRPAGSGDNQAGRPSSRHHQDSQGAEAGSKAAKPGPERPAATRSAASMARTREDPPFGAVEHPGTTNVERQPRSP